MCHFQGKLNRVLRPACMRLKASISFLRQEEAAQRSFPARLASWSIVRALKSSLTNVFYRRNAFQFTFGWSASLNKWK